MGRVRGELETKDNQLIGITSELERLREDQHSLKGEVEERGSAITTLQTELEKVRGEVVEKEQAIAKLESELAAGGDKQLSLFSEPEPIAPPEPTPIPTPEPEPEPEQLQPAPKVRGKGKTQKLPAVDKGKTEVEPPVGALTRGELFKHIVGKIPNPGITDQDLTDAVRDKDKKAKGSEFSRLHELERKFGFRYLGKIGSKHYFELLPEG